MCYARRFGNRLGKKSGMACPTVRKKFANTQGSRRPVAELLDEAFSRGAIQKRSSFFHQRKTFKLLFVSAQP